MSAIECTARWRFFDMGFEKGFTYMKKIGLFLAAAGLLTLLLTACDTSCRHWGMREIPYDPTCSQEGYVLHVCDECGHTYKSDIVEPYGHVMSHEKGLERSGPSSGT